MKLNWFSPLPPAKTGIARYSADLLPALCRRAEVTLWSDQPSWDENLNELAVIRHYDPFIELNVRANHRRAFPLFVDNVSERGQFGQFCTLISDAHLRVYARARHCRCDSRLR